MLNHIKFYFLYFFCLIILFQSCKTPKTEENIVKNNWTNAQKNQLEIIKKNYLNDLFFDKKECLWEKAIFHQGIEKNTFITIPILKNKKLVNFFWSIDEYLVFYIDDKNIIYKQESVMFVSDKKYFKRYENLFLSALTQPQQIIGDYTGFFLTFDLFSKQKIGHKYFNGKIIQNIDYQIDNNEIWLINVNNKLEKQYIAFLQTSVFFENIYEDNFSVGECLYTYLKNFREDSTAKTHQLILYLYEPAPNSSIGYFFMKIGHIYIALEQTLEDNTLIRRSIGFWPSEIVHPFYTITPSLIEREDWQKFTIKINIPLSKENFIKLKNNIIKDNNPLPIYDLEKFNCIDWIRFTLKKIDISLPESRISWGFGSASATGNLGYQLRKKYIQKQLPKNWDIQFAHFGFLTDNLH